MGHGHGHGHDRTDAALETSRRGMRALAVSFAVLMATAALQGVLVAVTASVALLGDTLHNLTDALTAVPLAVAFLLGRRAATKRFTYGLGRAEDLAGLVVVLLIAASAVAACYQAVARIVDPRPVEHLPLLAAAGLIGFIGNEWVARYRIRVGRSIGSAALVADGLHARTDALTSLAVIAAAAGAWLRIPHADAVIGLGMAALIALVLRTAAREVFARLLDGVDPALVDRATTTLATTPGVRGVTTVRLRWVGHRQYAEAAITTDDDATLLAAHDLALAAEHRLRHALPRLDGVTLHVDPLSRAGPHPV